MRDVSMTVNLRFQRSVMPITGAVVYTLPDAPGVVVYAASEDDMTRFCTAVTADIASQVAMGAGFASAEVTGARGWVDKREREGE